MISIGLCRDIRRAAAFCKDFDKIYGNEFYLYEAADNQGFRGGILFEVKSYLVEAVGYNGPNDRHLFDGLLRAGLNYAEKHGIEAGCLPETFRQSNHTLFAELNYPPETVFNIVNFFGKYKSCR